MGFLNSVVMIVFGLATCFLGKRYTRTILGLLSGLVAFYITGRVLVALEASGIVPFLGGVVVGILIGFVAYQFLYKWMFMVFGALLGMTLAGLIEPGLAIEGIIIPVLALVGAVIGGFLGYRFSDFIVEISTAISGAAFAVLGVITLSPFATIGTPLTDPATVSSTTPDDTLGIAIIIATAFLALLGYIFQRPG